MIFSLGQPGRGKKKHAGKLLAQVQGGRATVMSYYVRVGGRGGKSKKEL